MSKLLDALKLSLKVNQFAVANLDGTPGWPMRAELLALAELLLDPEVELDPFTRELGFAFRGFAKSHGPEPLDEGEKAIITLALAAATPIES